MACLPIRKCCCGCTLRKGSIIIGVAFGVLTLLTTVSMGATAEHTAIQNGKVDGEVGIYIVVTIVWIFFTITNLLLIIGATQEMTRLLMIWVAATTINLLIYVGMYSYACYVVIVDGSGSYAIVIVFCALAIVSLYAYCILIVYSYYLTIVSSRTIIEEQPPVPDPNARRWR
ncbi:uncharacterized protein [Anabrus simplex]|uniref:uncharacterized protein n=1 Tax=Anabrus simplex TaxID=316456 RepID=UPI0035A30C9D